MKRREFLRASPGVLALSIGLTGCATFRARREEKRQKEKKHKGHGPPPHAPAHGYRAKTADGIEIVFDSGLGVYLVVNVPDHYYSDGKYYRKRGDSWEFSLRFEGPWEIVIEADLPVGLRSEGKGKSKKEKSKDKGKSKEKRKDD